MDATLVKLISELTTLGFPKKMAVDCAVAVVTESGQAIKSPANTLPAFYIDGNDIILINTSLGLL